MKIKRRGASGYITENQRYEIDRQNFGRRVTWKVTDRLTGKTVHECDTFAQVEEYFTPEYEGSASVRRANKNR